MSEVPRVGFETLRWTGGPDGHWILIDQTRLPTECVEVELHDVESVWEAIKTLRVRGAPAIGIAAAYGVCIGMQKAAADDEATYYARLDEVIDYLGSSRPTQFPLNNATRRKSPTASAAKPRRTGFLFTIQRSTSLPPDFLTR